MLVESTSERSKGGRFAKRARSAQSAGGKAGRGKTRLASKLGPLKVTNDPTFVPYRKAAEDFKRCQVTAAARGVPLCRAGVLPRAGSVFRSRGAPASLNLHAPRRTHIGSLLPQVVRPSEESACPAK